ncbi:hypothetical protein M1N59_01375 [Dehalococcoidales bacterium]|nr:hypothetical protein [Dehalococcoidales bacterium]
MVANKSLGTNRCCHRLLEKYNQIPPLWACVTEHLGITILLRCLRDSSLDSFTTFCLPVFIPCCLASLLFKRHSISPSICKQEVATPEDVAYI